MAKQLILVNGKPTLPSVIIGDQWLRPKKGLTPEEIELIWQQCPEHRSHIIDVPAPKPTKEKPAPGDDSE
jgi:ABC-type cobalamin transport system permease subunit